MAKIIQNVLLSKILSYTRNFILSLKVINYFHLTQFNFLDKGGF